MKIVVFICLFCLGIYPLSAYAQSPRKINKELKQSVLVASTEYDSLKTAFATAMQDLEHLRLEIQNGKMKEFDEARAQFDRNWDRVKRIWRKLGDLGGRNGIILDYNNLYGSNPIYSYPKMVKSAIPLFSEQFKFTVSDQETITKEMPLEEQNVLLQEALTNYILADSVNRSCLIRIKTCINGINELDAQLDTCIADLQNRNEQFDEAWNLLHGKYEELRVEYVRSKNDKDVLSSLHKEFGLKNGTDFESIPISSPTFFQITQDEVKKRPEEEVICEIVEILAEFPSGRESMKTYITNNLDLPESVTSGKVIGKCYLRFVVSAYGTISNVKVQRGIQDCPKCDQAAVAVVKGMPNWIPAKNNGKPVNSWYTLPITFNTSE